MVKHSVFLFLILTRAIIGLGQINWPEDEQMAKLTREKVALYSDALKNDRIKEAVAPLQWLLQNVPDFSKGIYIDGVKVYQQLALKATEDHQEALSNQVLQLYDQRARYFPEGGELLNRKAWAAYEMYRHIPEKSEGLFQMIDEAVDSLQADVYQNLLIAQLDVLRVQATDQLLNQDVLFNVYFRNKDILNQKAGKGENVDNKLQMLDKLFFSLAKMDCSLIEEKFTPELSNFEQVKVYLGLALAYQCYQSESFIPSAEKLLKVEPDFGLAKLLAILYTKNKNREKALLYWAMALELTSEEKKKAEVYLAMAGVYQHFNQFAKARQQVLNALHTGEADEKEAYNLLGDLYAQSYPICKKGQSKVQDYSVFIAAWEMYAKAGNQERMQQMQSSFPSKEELHGENLTPGETYYLDCWIGKQIILKTRD